MTEPSGKAGNKIVYLPRHRNSEPVEEEVQNNGKKKDKLWSLLHIVSMRLCMSYYFFFL